MTVVLDRMVAEGVKEYNETMEPLEEMMAKLASRVSYFTLQKVDYLKSNPDQSGWHLSFVDSDAREMEDVDLRNLRVRASSVVFLNQPTSGE